MDIGAARELLGLQLGDDSERQQAVIAERRAALEEKIAQAPTPGLQAKYRSALEELEEAIAVVESELSLAPDLPYAAPQADAHSLFLTQAAAGAASEKTDTPSQLANAENRTATPEQGGTTEASPASAHLAMAAAPIGRRCLAGALDLFLLIVPMFMVAVGAMLVLKADEVGQRSTLSFIGIGLLSLSPWLFYETVATTLLGGQTLGKRLAGIVVRASGGNTMTFGSSLMRALVRVFLAAVPFVGFIDYLLIFFGAGQTLHDRLSGSRVYDLSDNQ